MAANIVPSCLTGLPITMVRVPSSSSRGIGLASSPQDAELVLWHLWCRRFFMRRCRLLFFAVALLLIAPGSRMRTAIADEWQPISPEELQMTSVPEAPGAPAVILYRQVDRDDSDRTGHQYTYVRIKILTEEGRKYADVEIPYFKEQGTIHGLKARTIRPDGTIANFEGKAFDKTIVKARGLKYLAKTFTLPDVQVGSIIEYRYTYDMTENYVYDSHWILSDELFTRSAKFSLKPYESDYSTMNVRWSWQGLPPGTAPPKQ